MLSSILSGECPSKLFRRILTEDTTMTNSRLAEILIDEFPALDGEAVSFIWHWMGPGRHQGISDDNLDILLRPLFEQAGYVISP
jgi:hypothetical protein